MVVMIIERLMEGMKHLVGGERGCFYWEFLVVVIGFWFWGSDTGLPLPTWILRNYKVFINNFIID